MKAEDLAPRDTVEFVLMPDVKWRVVACWERVDDSYIPERWVEVYHPDRGHRMFRVKDFRTELHTVPRPLNAARRPCR